MGKRGRIFCPCGDASALSGKTWLLLLLDWADTLGFGRAILHSTQNCLSGCPGLKDFAIASRKFHVLIAIQLSALLATKCKATC